MVVKLSNKINILSANLKVLIVGKLKSNIDDILSIYFTKKEYFELTLESFELLNNTLYEQFDLIIVVPNNEVLKNIPSNAIVILDEDNYQLSKEYINKVYSVVLDPIEEDDFANKLYGAIAILETNNIIKTKQKMMKRYENNENSHNIEEFLDQNSGTILFINDDLNEIVQRLKELEFSKKIIDDISLNMIKLSKIFTIEKNLKSLSILFREFEQFLQNLDLSAIEPSRYSSFDFLTNIIEDLTIYIDELFIYKIVHDTKLFEDSMQSNILYFEVKLFGNKDEIVEENNLEFF